MKTEMFEWTRNKMLAVALAVTLAVGGLTIATAQPAEALYTSPVLTATSGGWHVGGSNLTYNPTPQRAQAHHMYYRIGVQGRWTEHGVTDWTQWRYNSSTGGFAVAYGYYTYQMRVRY